MPGKRLLTLIAIGIVIFSFTATAFAGDAMNDTKEAYAKVPGGTVWLNPGDSYEHDTGLVRDQQGRHYQRPLNSNTQHLTPNLAPPVIRPTYPDPMPNHRYPQNPQVAPPAIPPFVYTPYYVTPSLSPVPYDTGPYLPLPQAPCPNCPSTYRQPTSHSWGLRGDPMNSPKTGDAPTYQ